jgi:hypothetical protein
MRKVVGVNHAGWKVYAKASGLYNKHQKNWELGNQWQQFPSRQDYHQGQSSSQQMIICIN